MKGVSPVLAVLVLCSMLAGQEIVVNGGFEDPLYDYTQYYDIDVNNKWISWWEGVSVSTDIVHSGKKALCISTDSIEGSGFVSQEVDKQINDFEVSFWMYPESDEYYNSFILANSWNFMDAFRVVGFWYTQDTIKLFGLREYVVFPNPMIIRSWNHIEIITDKSGLKRTLIINRKLVGSITMPQVLEVEHLIVGDITRRFQYGTIYYDDFTVTNRRGYSYWAKNKQIPRDQLKADVAPVVSGMETRTNKLTAVTSSGVLSARYSVWSPGQVKLELIDMSGRPVMVLFNGMAKAGEYQLSRHLDPYLPEGTFVIRFRQGTGESLHPVVRVR